MNSKYPWGPQEEVFIGETDDPAHQFILQTFDWGADSTLELNPEDKLSLVGHVHLAARGFFRRLQIGFLYICGRRSKFGDFEVMTFKNEDVDRLLMFLIAYKKKMGKYLAKAGAPLPEAGIEAPAERIDLDHLPARYGVKFLWGNVSLPLASVFYAYNGTIQKEGVRLDLAKKTFLDKFAHPQIGMVAEMFKDQIIKALTMKVKNDKSRCKRSEETEGTFAGDQPNTPQGN